MARQPRRFQVNEGVRKATPLLIGLFGPSGSGKTYTALELAQGIQSVVGGEVVGIDTENRRMLAYADKFRFKHIDFQPPFGSLDYLDALTYAVNEYGAKTVIVDSMSHEHEGPGGMLETHEAEAIRMATWNGVLDERKIERVKMLAWNKPKQQRRALINGILRLQANFIFCFRAKATSKPQKVKDDNGREKTEVLQLGYMPIAGEEFVFEMTAAALLPPGAQGVPAWHSEFSGERSMIKLPDQFKFLEDEKRRGRPLDAKVGAALARWAQGGEKPAREPQGEQGGPAPSGDTQNREDPPQREPERTQGPSSDNSYEGI